MKLLVLLLLFVCAILTHTHLEAAAETCKSITAPLTFEKIETALEECKIKTIEELLSLLPPDFRSRFVLVHASRSLQGASARFPRVIMFGLDAKLILAFTGSPDLKGYHSLETIEFDDGTKKFHFRSISFPSETDFSRVAIKPEISERNPEGCMTCHRQELRPNWDTYSAWPGVYGSKDDGMPAAEKEAYRNFMDNTYLKEGRYRYFDDADKIPDAAWYYDYFPSGRTNLQFSWLLSLLNSQAIAREIKENSKLYPFRYALLASLKCDDDFNDPEVLAQSIPENISSRFHKSYRQVATEVENSIEASYRLREERQRKVLASLGSSIPMANWEHKFKPLELCCASNTSRLSYIMEGAGVPFPKWSMEFGSKHHVFFAGEVGEMGELGLFLWQELLDPVHDSELYQIYLDAWNQKTNRGDMVFPIKIEDLCGKLRKNSLTMLSSH